MPGKVIEVEFDYSFVGTSGDNCAVVILCSQSNDRNSTGVPQNMVHVVFAGAGVNVDEYTDGTPTTIDSFGISPSLALDGTVYHGKVTFDGASVTVTMPDGTTKTATDPSLDKAGRYITIEDFIDTGQDATPRFENITVISQAG